MCKLLVLSVILCLSGVGGIYAAPVDVPTEVQGLEENIFKNEELGIGLSIAGEADFLSKRKLDVNKSESTEKVKGRFYTTKIILTLANKFDIYGIFGKAENLECKTSYGSKIKPKDKLTWGAGLSVPIYEWKDYGIKFFADGKYRMVDNIDYYSNYVSILSGIAGTHSNNYTVPKLLVDWQEWQVALGVAKRFKYFMPYLGVKYSDFRESIDATDTSVAYSDTIIGLFVGCGITPMKAFSIDLQGRFIDETAFAVKATYKF